MKFNWINISLIKIFYNFKEREKLELAEIRDIIFPDLSKVEKDRKLVFIRDQLRAMPNDLFDIKKNKYKWEYNLKTENILFRKFTFIDKRKEGLAVKINSKWQIYEL